MDATFPYEIISGLAMRSIGPFQHVVALLILASVIAGTARADVISIDSSFLDTNLPSVTIEQQTIFFLEKGYTPAEMGFPRMTTQR